MPASFLVPSINSPKPWGTPKVKKQSEEFGGAGCGEVISSYDFFLLRSQALSGDLQKLRTSRFVFYFCLATAASFPSSLLTPLFLQGLKACPSLGSNSTHPWDHTEYLLPAFKYYQPTLPVVITRVYRSSFYCRFCMVLGFD